MNGVDSPGTREQDGGGSARARACVCVGRRRRGEGWAEKMTILERMGIFCSNEGFR